MYGETENDLRFLRIPDELYRIKYPSPGAPGYANSVIDSVKAVKVRCDIEWGLDHASWAILKHMYPEADIPTFEMSLDYSFNEWYPKPLRYHYNLASQLGELRKKGILIIGSGNIVHNLRLVDFEQTDAPPFDWAVEFDETVKENLIQGNHKDLLNCENIGRAASYAVPTLDHYLPMVYAIGLQQSGEPLTFTYEGFQNASVSMRSFKIG